MLSIKKTISFSVIFFLVLSLFSFAGVANDVLRIAGSSTVYPIANWSARYWRANPEPGSKFWPASKFGITTDKNLTNYWISRYGLKDFRVQVSLGHSGKGLRKLEQGRVDIGNSSAAVRYEFPDKPEEELDKFTAHIVGYDRQAFSVSEEVYEAGCTVLTKQEIRGIIKGEITNWKQIHSCGYDKEIQLIARAVGSGTETMFRVKVFGSATVSGLDGVDIRLGQNQMVKQALVRSDNGIGYPGIDFISEENPAVKIIWDNGKKYSITDQGWPLGRPLYMYTWKGTSKKETAFLRMILSDFGQKEIVQQRTAYYMLSEKEQADQLKKLPDVE